MHLGIPTKEDLDIIFSDLREPDLRAVLAGGGIEASKEYLLQLKEMFPCVAFYKSDNTPVAVMIGLRKWEGVIEVSGYTANGVEDEKHGFYRGS